MKTYLVTGGAGFLGSALVRRLVRLGHRVRVLDNQSRGSIQRLEDVQKAVLFIDADIRDAEAVSRATQGVDCVCHLASVNGTVFFYAKPELVLEVGIRGILNVLDACRSHHVGELVLVSSSEVYQTAPSIPTPETVPLVIPDPHNPRYSYAAAKLISEIMAIHYGRAYFQRVILVRPHNVYGPDMGSEHVIPQFILRMRALRGGAVDPLPFPIQGTGRETRAFVYIDDFIEGFLVAMERGEHFGIYNIGTTQELTVEEVATQVGRYFGRRIAIQPSAVARGSPPRRCPDIRKLMGLGYAPRIRFQEGLPIVAKWYEEHAGRELVAGN